MSPFVVHAYDCNRLLNRTVDAVIGYAYTGSVELTVENAEPIFLLAVDLQCKGLVAKCVELLIQR